MQLTLELPMIDDEICDRKTCTKEMYAKIFYPRSLYNL